jgi:hypothetical protein
MVNIGTQKLSTYVMKRGGYSSLFLTPDWTISTIKLPCRRPIHQRDCCCFQIPCSSWCHLLSSCSSCRSSTFHKTNSCGKWTRPIFALLLILYLSLFNLLGIHHLWAAATWATDITAHPILRPKP